jgi:hypothetical protein
VYSSEHLAAQPLQAVSTLRMFFEPPDAYDDIWVVVDATLADQGRARGEGFGGQTLDQLARCDHYNDGPGCAIDCDGGSFDLTLIAENRIEVTLTGFPVGDTESCGGAFNLAEVWGQPTTYRLFRADESACEGLQ